MDKPVWEKPNPVKKSSKLSPMQKAKARARARAAGRPYPNMVDNIWAARNESYKKHRSPYIHFKFIEHNHAINEDQELDDFLKDLMAPIKKPRVKPGAFPKHGNAIDAFAQSTTPGLKWRDRNDNEHLGKTSPEISRQLYNTTPKLSSSERKTVQFYTNHEDSPELNKALISGKLNSTMRDKAIKLHDIVSKPLGHKINLYSGVGSDPRGWEKSSDGSTHLRAATSMTHDKLAAHFFATSRAADTSAPTHIIHLHVKPSDRGMYVAHHSDNADEYETVLPPGTHIKPHPDFPKPEEHTDSEGKKVFIHHYVIHKQSEPGKYAPEGSSIKEMFEEFKLKRLGSNPGKFKRLVAKHLGAKAAEKIDGADGSRIMAMAKRKGDTALFRKGSFIKNFYGEAYEEGSKEIRVAYARMTPGQTPFILGLDKDVPQDNARELRRRRAKKIYKAYFDEANEGKTLGKPFRTPGEKKKFAVYVRNDRGNVVKVRFGDPNLSIKRDNPARRKSFRARHNCANPGPRTKARYWSCRQWRASAKVEA